MRTRIGEATLVKPDEELERRFAAFVAQHRQRAVGMAWRLVGGEGGAAEDVAQEAFARAYRALPRFRDAAQLSTWFHRILVNEARSHLRWRAVRRRFGGEMPAEIADPAAPVHHDSGLRRRIFAALESLPRGQREVFVLIHLEGMSLREAAQATGRAEGTVKSHLHRALGKLRRELADLQTAQPGPTEAATRGNT